jgi:hypothetical protein
MVLSSSKKPNLGTFILVTTFLRSTMLSFCDRIEVIESLYVQTKLQNILHSDSRWMKTFLDIATKLKFSSKKPNYLSETLDNTSCCISSANTMNSYTQISESNINDAILSTENISDISTTRHFHSSDDDLSRSNDVQMEQNIGINFENSENYITIYNLVTYIIDVTFAIRSIYELCLALSSLLRWLTVVSLRTYALSVTDNDHIKKLQLYYLTSFVLSSWLLTVDTIKNGTLCASSLHIGIFYEIGTLVLRLT